MIKARCVQKFRDKHNCIVGYKLVAYNGDTRTLKAEDLKKAIKNNIISVDNLTLTSDNRLVSKEIKLSKNNLQLLEICAVAKSLVWLDKELTGMGDSFSEIVENVVYESGLTGVFEDLYDADDESLNKILYNAYIKLAKENPSAIEERLSYIFDPELEYYEQLEHDLEYEEADDIKKTDLYNVFSIFKKYGQGQGKFGDTLTKINTFLDNLSTRDMVTIKKAAKIANSYYKYLDSSIFGSLSNDVFTVGHVVVESDIKENSIFKGYEYVCHKDFNVVNRPNEAIAVMFKNNMLEIRIATREDYKKPYRYSEVVDKMGLHDITESDYIAKALASKLNELGGKIRVKIE